MATVVALMREEVKVTVHSALTILNAIPCLRGIAVGTSLPVTVTVREAESLKVEAEDTDYVKFLVNKFRERFQLRESQNVEIVVFSEIPPRSGLKSSSAVAVAIICGLALFHELDLTLHQCLRLAAEWSREFGVSFTGALDDAAACLLGGVVYTDNYENVVLRHLPIDILGLENTEVMIVIPRGWRKAPRERIEKLRLLRSLYQRLFEKALQTERALLDLAQINTQLLCQVLGYDVHLVKVLSEITHGIALLSGNGPALAVLNYSDELNEETFREIRSRSELLLFTSLRDLELHVEDPVSRLRT